MIGWRKEKTKLKIESKPLKKIVLVPIEIKFNSPNKMLVNQAAKFQDLRVSSLEFNRFKTKFTGWN